MRDQFQLVIIALAALAVAVRSYVIHTNMALHLTTKESVNRLIYVGMSQFEHRKN